MSDGPSSRHRQPPGWYVDPYGQGSQRWWDGGQWTEATRPNRRGQPTPIPSPQTPLRRLPSPGDGRGDWGVSFGGQSWLRPEPPPVRHADPLSFRHANDVVTRVNESFIDADDNHGVEDCAGPWNIARETGNRSGTAPRAVDGRPVRETNSAAEEKRRSGLSRLALSVLFFSSLVLFAAGVALDDHLLRLVAVIGALFFGVGTAPLQLSEYAPLNLRLCVAGLVGLSVPLIVGSVMLLMPIWHPSLAAVLFGAVAVWVHLVACRRMLSRPLEAGILRSARLRSRDFLDASVACSLVGTLLWLAGMAATGHVVPGVLGFLPNAPVYWYLGLVMLVAGIMLARDGSELRPAFGAVSLLAALTLTPSVVYGMPRSESAAKHIDLVQNILQGHSLSSDVGIYRAYSGFFSAVAWLCDVSGMHNVTEIATYFPFFIDLIVVAGLRFLFGRLTASRYRIWVAIMLAILVNSSGADYFSPQAAGFALAVGVFGLALDWESDGLSERWRIGIMVLVGCAMAVTHELSPYIAGGVLVILVVFRVIRPWYIPATILIPAVFWAFLHMTYVSGFFSLGDLGKVSNFAPPKTVSTPGLQRLPIVAESSDALALALLVLIAIACLGLLRNVRSRPAWAFMISPGVGLILIVVNPYGNEGIFRAALFGIPWLAAVGTQALPFARSRWATAIHGFIAVGLAGSYLVSAFGLDNTNVIRPDDYQALLTYQATAPPDSYLLRLSYGIENLPVSIGFPQGNGHSIGLATLITKAQVDTIKPSSHEADILAHWYYQFAKRNDGKTSQLYALWSPALAEYDVDYGLEPLALAESWRSALIASPDWKVVYSGDGTYLFRVAPNVSASVKSGKKTSKNQ
jgi:hypothetical protein